jgi:hypothetical protein
MSFTIPPIFKYFLTFSYLKVFKSNSEYEEWKRQERQSVVDAMDEVIFQVMWAAPTDLCVESRVLWDGVG